MLNFNKFITLNLWNLNKFKLKNKKIQNALINQSSITPSKLSGWVERSFRPKLSNVRIHNSKNGFLKVINLALVFQNFNHVVLLLLCAGGADCALVDWNLLHNLSCHFSCWSSWKLIFQRSYSLLFLIKLISEVSHLIFKSVDFSSVNLRTAVWAGCIHIAAAAICSFILNNSALFSSC